MPRDIPKMPDGLEDLLRGLSKAVLKDKPENILEFSAKYFENLLIERDGSLRKNYERFELYEKSLNKKGKQKKLSATIKLPVKNVVKSKNSTSNSKVVKPAVAVEPNKGNGKNKKLDKVPSPIFGDKVAEKEPTGTRKIMETAPPRGKLKTRTKSSISLIAITEETNNEIKDERKFMYRTAVKKIQRAFRKYAETKKQKSLSTESEESVAPSKMDENQAAKIIQNLFKAKFPKKRVATPSQPIKNKHLERVGEVGEDSKSLLEYLQEEENAIKTQTNVEHDSDTGETITTLVDEVKLTNADSLENMIINDDINRELNAINNIPSTNNVTDQGKEQAAIKIQSTFRGHQARKELKHRQTAINSIMPAASLLIEDRVATKNDADKELDAVTIQSKNESSEVRKDINSTKNVVENDNLVAAINLASVDDQLNSKSSDDPPSVQVDSNDGKSVAGDKMLSGVYEVHGLVYETPEVLNGEKTVNTVLDNTDLNDAAIKIQKSYRGYQTRKNKQRIHPVIGIEPIEPDLITTDALESSLAPEMPVNNEIQSDIGNENVDLIGQQLFLSTDSLPDLNDPEMTNAALKIQKSFRGHQARKEIDQKKIKQKDTTERPTDVSDPVSLVQYSNGNDDKAIDREDNLPDLENFESKDLKKVHIVPEVVIDGASEEFLSDTENADEIQYTEKTVPSATNELPVVGNTKLSEAAVKIQKLFRGYQVRKELKPKKGNSTEITTSVPADRDHNSRVQGDLLLQSDDKVEQASVVVEGLLKQNPIEVQKLEINLVQKQNDAAVKIQKTYRGHQVRNELKAKKGDLKILGTQIDVPIDSKDLSVFSDEISEIVPKQQELVFGLNDLKVTDANIQFQKPFEDENKTNESNENENEKLGSNVQERKIDIEKNPRNDTSVKDLKSTVARKLGDIPPAASETLINVPPEVATRNNESDFSEVTKSLDSEINTELKPYEKMQMSEVENDNLVGSELSSAEATDTSQNNAAVKIQKSYRGYKARKEYKQRRQDLQQRELDKTELKNSPIDTLDVILLGIPNVSQSNDQSIHSKQDEMLVDRLGHANQKLDGFSHEDVQLPIRQDSLPDLNDPEMADAALKIQKSFRGHQARKQIKQEPDEYIGGHVGTQDVSESVMSTLNQGHDMKTIDTPVKHKDSIPDLDDPEIADAALKIQKSFRGYQARKGINQNKIKEYPSSTNTSSPNQSNLPILETPIIIDGFLKRAEALPSVQDSSTKLSHSGMTNNRHLEHQMEISDSEIQKTFNQPMKEEVISNFEAENLNSSKREHQESLPDLNDPEMAEAALKIQKSFRGHQVRKEFNQKSSQQAKEVEGVSLDIPNQLQINTNQHKALKPEETVLNSETSNIISNRLEHQPESLPDFSDPEMADSVIKMEPLHIPNQLEIISNINQNKTLEPSEAILNRDVSILKSTLEHEESLPDLNDPEITDAAIKIQNKTFEPSEPSPNRDVSILKSTLEHEESLLDLNNPEIADAPLKIQKSFRGHQARKELKPMTSNQTGAEGGLSLDNATNLQSINPFQKHENENVKLDQEFVAADKDTSTVADINANSTTIVENQDETETMKEQQDDSLPDLNDPEMANAALKIQKSFRGHQVRKENKQLAKEQSSNLVDSAKLLTKSDGQSLEPTTFENSTPPIISDEPLKLVLETVPDGDTNKVEEKITNITLDKTSVAKINIAEHGDLEKVESTATEDENQRQQPNSTKIEPDESLPDLNDPEMTDAALKIQKSFRGHQARKETQQNQNNQVPTIRTSTEPIAKQVDQITPAIITTQHPDISTTSIDGERIVVDDNSNKNVIENQTQNDFVPVSVVRQDSLPDLTDPEMTDAALKIQKSFRGHQARKEFQERRLEATTSNKNDVVTFSIQTKTDTEDFGNANLEKTVEEKAEIADQIQNQHPDSIKINPQENLPGLNGPEMADGEVKIQKPFGDHKVDEINEKITEQVEGLRKKRSTNSVGEFGVNQVSSDEKKSADLNLDLPLLGAKSLEHPTNLDKSGLTQSDELPDLNDPEMADAARTIQKSFRDHKVRKEFKETQENIAIGKILSNASAPPINEIEIGIQESFGGKSSNVLDSPTVITKLTNDAAINIQRAYRGYRSRRDLKDQSVSQQVPFEDDNKLVDSLEPIFDQKPEDKIDADSLDNFNIEERTEVVEEPCQKIIYKSKLSMLLENSKSDTQSSSSEAAKPELRSNDDYFDSLENAQTSEMDESTQTVIEVKQSLSIPDNSYDGQNTFDSSLFGIKIDPVYDHDHEVADNSMSRKTTAEVNVAQDNQDEVRGGMTDDEIKEIQNVDLASFEKDSLEAMYYSLRKNELLLDQMHSASYIETESISEQMPPRQFTSKQKLLSMGESDSDDIVFKQLSIDYDEYSEVSNQHTARSTTDDDADVEVIRDVLYYNDGKQVLPEHNEVKEREPGDGASVASDNLFDNHSNADDLDAYTKSSAHHFEIFSLDEEIRNLESNDPQYTQNNPLFYAQEKIEKFLHQIHGNKNDTEDDADDENDDDFVKNPIDMQKSYLSESNFSVEDEEEDDVVKELRSDFKETSGRKVLASAVSEADSDYFEQSKAVPIKDDFNISTALDSYLSTDSDSTYNSAATKIQAGARGFLTRRRIQSINRQSMSERRSSIGNAAIDQSLDDMIEENEERKKHKFHEAQSTFREDTITSSGELEMYGITDIKVEEKKLEIKIASPITDSGNESTTSVDTETQNHLRNRYERFENESSFDAIDEDNLSDVVDVIRTSNVQNKLRSPMTNKDVSNLNFDEYDRVATRRMTLQRGNAVQGNSTPSDEENRSNATASDGSSSAPNSDEKNNNLQNDEPQFSKTSYDSPIRRMSQDSTLAMAKSSNSLPDMEDSSRKRGFIQRQRTMPVQIETEIIRPLPKHMRKRIKSANSSANGSHSTCNMYKKKATF